MSHTEFERKVQEAAKYRDENEESKAKIEGAPPMYDAQHSHRGKSSKTTLHHSKAMLKDITRNTST